MCDRVRQNIFYATEYNFTELYLEDNKLTDISALKNLVSLSELNLADNKIKDISALKNLTCLTTLYLDHNPACDLETADSDY